MNIDGVNSGIVLDHITAGRSMDIYHYLHLDELDCCVAIIKNGRLVMSGRTEDVVGNESLESVFLELEGED